MHKTRDILQDNINHVRIKVIFIQILLVLFPRKEQIIYDRELI